MHSRSRPAALMSRTHEPFAPKIYYFHPLLAGPRDTWPAHLSRCQDMGFDHVVSAPLFAPGEAGDLFLTADHERIHPAVKAPQPADEVVKELVEACRARGLKLLLDVVLGRVAADASLVESNPEWFHVADATGVGFDPRFSRRA